jgi:cytochrome oxidase Cu insertion factor (SCO1/SenC/PrrC family)
MGLPADPRRHQASKTRPRPRAGRRGPLALAGALMACLALAACGGSSAVSGLANVPTSNRGVDPGSSLGGHVAPNFTLLDQFGRRVTLSQFRGKAVLLAFVDSHCTTVCPLTTEGMVQALRMLGHSARDVQLVGIDANPDATRVADVRDYSVAHDMMHSWVFLTGSVAQLKHVWKDYDVYVQAVAGNIDHEAATYLIRPDGREQSVYLTQMSYASVPQQAVVLADATAAVLRSHPAVANTVNLSYRSGIAPTASISLPVVGGSPSGGIVRLGHGRPHLVVFFATWTDENTNLTTQLLALNDYQRIAARRDWPPVVAIDEATTEPSPTALSSALARLPAKLDYPVVADRTGRIADGYDVQDEPWVELVSASGKILFSNDGWFPTAALERAVQKALRSRS